MAAALARHVDQIPRLLQGRAARPAGRFDDAFTEQRQSQQLQCFAEMEDLVVKIRYLSGDKATTSTVSMKGRRQRIDYGAPELESIFMRLTRGADPDAAADTAATQRGDA